MIITLGIIEIFNSKKEIFDSHKSIVNMRTGGLFCGLV